mgnify:CR=1 FL=1
MQQTYLNWIPSVQRYVRFNEFTTQHQLFLSKARQFDPTEVDLEFTYTLNQVLSELCTEDIDFDMLTVVDKFACVLQMVIACFGSTQKFSMACPKCENGLSIDVDFNKHLQMIAPKLDHNFVQVLKVGDDCSLTCNVPTIGNEYMALQWLADKGRPGSEDEQIDTFFDMSVASYITNISVGEHNVNLVKMPFKEKREIFMSLPLPYLQQVKEDYIANIDEVLTPFDLDQIKCTCGYVNNITFSVGSLNMLVRLFLNAGSPEAMYQDLYDLATKVELPPQYVLTITPGERSAYKQIHRKQQQAKSREEQIENSELDSADFDNDGPLGQEPTPERLTPAHLQPTGTSSF